MERLKTLSGFIIVATIISFSVSVFVFRYMINDAIDKLLGIQEVMVIQTLVSNTAAIQNLVNARFQDVEENLYTSLGLNMTHLKEIYDKHGRLPDKTIAGLIQNVSRFRQSSELTRNEKFKNVFNPEIVDFMDKVEKAAKDGILTN